MGIFKSIGQTLGLVKEDAVPQFKPDTAQFDADSAYLRKIRDTPPDKLRKSTGIQLGQLDKDRAKTLDKLQQQGRGVFATAQQQQALTGGLGTGSNERLSRRFLDQQMMNNQNVASVFDKEGAGLRAGDFANQEGLKDKAAFALPGIGMQQSQIQTQAAANNMNARQAALSAQKKRDAAVGGLFGSAIGVGMGGGATGAMLGGGIGQGLFG